MGDLQLKGIAGGPISYYEVAQVLKACTEAIERLPGKGVVQNVDNTIEEGMARLLNAIKLMNEKLLETEQQIAAADKKLFDETEEYYNTSYKRVKELRERFDKLPKLPEINVPYGVGKIVELAQQCSNFTDEQWDRVIALAKAFAVRSE